MNRVLPAVIEVWILTAHAVVKNWRLVDRLEHLTRLATMHIIVLTWVAHLDHIHHVLSIRVLLLPQIEQFEFLTHWRLVSIAGNVAVRAQRLFCNAIFFRMCEALVLLNLCQPLFFFHTEFDVIECIIRKAHQVGCNGDGELAKTDFTIWVVTKAP